MCDTTTSKKALIFFNLICTLLALVIIAFGFYIICAYTVSLVDGMAAYSYIGIGAAALVILLLGCIGALRESVCCTITFIVLLFVVIIGQVVLSVLLATGQKTVSSNLANSLDTTWEEELKNPGAMSIYEDWFACCGRASPQDYIVNERMPPITCFKNKDNTLPENLIETGCRVEFENYWRRLLFIFNILTWVLIGLELLGAFVSCCLCNSIRNDMRRSYF